MSEEDQSIAAEVGAISRQSVRAQDKGRTQRDWTEIHTRQMAPGSVRREGKRAFRIERRTRRLNIYQMTGKVTTLH